MVSIPLLTNIQSWNIDGIFEYSILDGEDQAFNSMSLCK